MTAAAVVTWPVAATGEAVAYRAADGRLAVMGRGRNAFASEQWLRADADGRQASEALTKAGCDKLGCVGHLASGQAVSLIFDRAAFAEDCFRADIIITPLFAPAGCAAALVIDRDTLKEKGAVALSFSKAGVEMRSVRAPDEDRPWSPAPRRRWRPEVVAAPVLASGSGGADSEARDEPDGTEDEAALDE